MNIAQMSIKAIKNAVDYKKNPFSIEDDVLNQLKKDERKAVQEVYNAVVKTRQAIKQENQRLLKLFSFEQALWDSGLIHIAGVDEVGRGPLAGPVVAACVIFPKFEPIAGLNDSKLVPPARRAELEEIIKATALAWSIAIVDNDTIDNINIHQASLLAMRNAVENLSLKPQKILVDGFTIPGIDMDQQGIVKGDQNIASIAAASILAKCVRDRIMDNYALEYPSYGFEKHKGYGTKEHYQNIDTYGVTPIHRKSFLRGGESN